MNPTATHNTELKSATYSLVPTTASAVTSGATSDLLHLGQQRPPSYGAGSGNPSSTTRFHNTAPTSNSFAPLVTVDTTEGTDFPEYFSPTAAASNIPSSFNPPCTFASHHPVQSSYASLIPDTDLYASRQISQPAPLQYMNSMSGGAAPSLQRFIGGLTNKLPDLQCVTGSGNIDAAYPSSHMCGLGSSTHATLISPAYSPSSVTTQGSGGGSCKRAVLEADSKPGAFKSRSKKESHNRIERRRRDYINSQITRLGGLLPPDMYRDVDGRRNKGTVLRLSVNYILELRQAVVHTASLRQETAIARQLIPLLLNQIQALEIIIKEVEMATGKPLRGAAGSLLEEGGTRHSESCTYEAVLEAWRAAMTANLARPSAVPACAGENNSGSQQQQQQEGKMEPSSEVPIMENVQVAFVGRSSTNTPATLAAVTSSYLPNAVFVGAPVCKLEEGEEVCYASAEMSTGGGGSGHHVVVGSVAHPPEDTTDGFFDSTNSNNNNANNAGGSSSSVHKFDLSIIQMTSASNGAECGGDPVQVECQNR